MYLCRSPIHRICPSLPRYNYWTRDRFLHFCFLLDWKRLILRQCWRGWIRIRRDPHRFCSPGSGSGVRKENMDPDTGAITWTIIKKKKLYFTARPTQLCVRTTVLPSKMEKNLQQSVDPDSGPHGSALVWFPGYWYGSARRQHFGSGFALKHFLTIKRKIYKAPLNGHLRCQSCYLRTQLEFFSRFYHEYCTSCVQWHFYLLRQGQSMWHK